MYSPFHTATTSKKSNIIVDSIRRSLPISCCLVVKASNSANKNHEAESVPWIDLMTSGAISHNAIILADNIYSNIRIYTYE